MAIKDFEGTADPIVVTSPQEQEQPTFFKKDIEKIAEEVAKKISVSKFDADNPPEDCVEVEVVEGERTVAKIIADGNLPCAYSLDDAYVELTEEQYNLLLNNIKKAVKQGLVFYTPMYLILNLVKPGDDDFAACFGCSFSDGHSVTGAHLEFGMSRSGDERGLWAYINEI